MIDLRHPLASRLHWAQIEAALAPRFVQIAGAGVAAAGRPRLPQRLMASSLYLKHAYGLSDEELLERWAENVVWQHFSGMAFYEPRLPCDATQIGRVRAGDHGHHGAGKGHRPPGGLAAKRAGIALKCLLAPLFVLLCMLAAAFAMTYGVGKTAVRSRSLVAG